MKIGVKYCGGCNSHYDRKAEVEKMERRFSKIHFEPALYQEEYDRILLVCGCRRACIRNYRIESAGARLLLQEEKDFEEIDFEEMKKASK